MIDAIANFAALQWAWKTLRYAESVAESRAIIKNMLERLGAGEKIDFAELIKNMDAASDTVKGYAIEIYNCSTCGFHPVRIMVSLPSKEPVIYKSKQCHQCGSTQLLFEKVHACDQNGRIIE